MPLGKHTKTEEGRFRKERSDSLAGNLAKDYPAFKDVNPRTKLGTLEKKFGVTSVKAVAAELKKQNK